MAKNDRNRQKKLERKAAKRKERKKSVARQQAGGLMGQLVDAVKGPILHCKLTNDIWDQGIGWALISRSLPNGKVAFAIFLIDRFCLGVKNVIADVVHEVSYQTRILDKSFKGHQAEDYAPARLRKFIEQSVAYAEQFGLHPHQDYEIGMALFGSVDANECTEEFEFGKDGKPFYFAGPNETLGEAKAIVALLAHHCGEGNYHFTIPAVPSSDFTKLRHAPGAEMLLGDDEGDEDDMRSHHE